MDEQELRRRRREFVRQHHPDRGGDPAAFVAGMQQFEPAPEQQPRVTVTPKRSRTRRVLGAVRATVRRRRRPSRVR